MDDDVFLKFSSSSLSLNSFSFPLLSHLGPPPPRDYSVCLKNSTTRRKASFHSRTPHHCRRCVFVKVPCPPPQFFHDVYLLHQSSSSPHSFFYIHPTTISANLHSLSLTFPKEVEVIFRGRLTDTRLYLACGNFVAICNCVLIFQSRINK